MPELPEITSRAREMEFALKGKTIAEIEIIQPKSLNESPSAFKKHLKGAIIKGVANRGKWLIIETSQGYLLINLGMGGEILLVDRKKMPKKYRLVFDFLDRSSLAINFWWFGYVHFAPLDGLMKHPMVSKIGPNALEVDVAQFKSIVGNRKKAIKTILLDQSEIAGIGNAYIHDILFLAHLHPLRPANTLNNEDIVLLVKAIHDGLEPSLSKHGAFYELTLHGEKGGFLLEDILIGYREGKPCPVCKTSIEKIKTGSTSSFICPKCQTLS